MIIDGSRRWGAGVAVGLSIAAMVLSSGCTGRTDAATAVPPATATSGETASAVNSTVILQFNPFGYTDNRKCAGEIIGTNANAVDILIAKACSSSSHPNPWEKVVEMTYVAPKTGLTTKTVSHDVQVSRDEKSDLAVVTAMLDWEAAKDIIPARMISEKSLAGDNQELVALVFDKEVRGMILSPNSAEFHACESYSEMARKNMKLPPNWFYFYSPANGGILKNDQGTPLFNPETKAFAAMVQKTMPIALHLPGVGYDCSIAFPVQENAINSLLANNHLIINLRQKSVARITK